MAHDNDFTTEILQRLSRIEEKQDYINEKIAAITDGCKDCEKDINKLKEDMTVFKTRWGIIVAVGGVIWGLLILFLGWALSHFV